MENTNLALVPVFTGTINSQSVQLCDARTLHTFMVVLRDFTTWIKARIQKFGFVEDIDYLLTKTGEQVPHQGGTRKVVVTDYHLTLDMAKELAMVENNAKGREARRYFIDCEKKALAAPAAPYSVSPDQTLSAEQAGTLRGMLDEACKALAKDLQGMFMTQGWGKLKAHFKTDYRHIPAAQFTEAVSIVSRHIVKFSGTRVLPAPADDKPKFSLLQKRWLVYFDCNGVECAKPVPTDAFVFSAAELPQLILQADSPFSTNDVLQIAQHANLRMTNEVGHIERNSEASRMKEAVLAMGASDLTEIAKSAWLELAFRTATTNGITTEKLL